MPFKRIATCCYCGTTANLPKKPVPGRIGCASCGAPLRRIGTPVPVAPAPARLPPRPAPLAPPPHRETRRRKSLFTRVWDKLEDAVEDLIDKVFD